jgi:hypothetical protein
VKALSRIGGTAPFIWAAFCREEDPVRKIAEVLRIVGWKGEDHPTWPKALEFAEQLWQEVLEEMAK